MRIELTTVSVCPFDEPVRGRLETILIVCPARSLCGSPAGAAATGAAPGRLPRAGATPSWRAGYRGFVGYARVLPPQAEVSDAILHPLFDSVYRFARDSAVHVDSFRFP